LGLGSETLGTGDFPVWSSVHRQSATSLRIQVPSAFIARGIYFIENERKQQRHDTKLRVGSELAIMYRHKSFNNSRQDLLRTTEREALSGKQLYVLIPADVFRSDENLCCAISMLGLLYFDSFVRTNPWFFAGDVFL
jgi:hypothetical protein